MKRFVTASICVLALLSAAPAQADLLFFSPLGIVSEAYDGPTHPVPVGDDGFRLSFHGGGSKTLVDPVLLILGVPEGTDAPILSLGADDGFTTALIDLGGTTTSYGGSWNTTTGFAGTFDGDPEDKVYEFIGLTPDGNSSQNFTNWSGASGLSSWDLYVWTLTFTPDMQSTNPDWVEVMGDLAPGTFAIAYGCSAMDASGACTGTVQSTPFTRSGYVTDVPEPASWTLLIPALGLLSLRRKQRSSRNTV
jgi:hypothetical protein